MAENSEKKVGRPPAEEPRNRRIEVRLTEMEYFNLFHDARRKGFCMSEYIRKMIGF